MGSTGQRPPDHRPVDLDAGHGGRRAAGLGGCGGRLAGPGGCGHRRATQGRQLLGRADADPGWRDDHAALHEGTELAGGSRISAAGRRGRQATRQPPGRRRTEVCRATGRGSRSIGVQRRRPDRRGQRGGAPDHRRSGADGTETCRAVTDRAVTSWAVSGRAVTCLAVTVGAAERCPRTGGPGTGAAADAAAGGRRSGGATGGGSDGLPCDRAGRLAARCRQVLRPDGAAGLPPDRRIGEVLSSRAQPAHPGSGRATGRQLPAHRAQRHRQAGRVGARGAGNDRPQRPSAGRRPADRHAADRRSASSRADPASGNVGCGKADGGTGSAAHDRPAAAGRRKTTVVRTRAGPRRTDRPSLLQ